MAFVYKAPRNIDKEDDVQQPGPGNYNVNRTKQISHGYAPFGSTCNRNKEKKVQPEEKKRLNKLDELFAKENQAVTEAIAVKRQTSVFCSESKRFQQYNDTIVPDR